MAPELEEKNKNFRDERTRYGFPLSPHGVASFRESSPSNKARKESMGKLLGNRRLNFFFAGDIVHLQRPQRSTRSTEIMSIH